MAGFCSKCGASLPSASGFCPKCGAAVGAGVVPPQAEYSPVQWQTPASPPPYTQTAATGGYPPAPAARSGGGGALKIILVVVAVVVGIGVIGAGFVGYGVWRVAHAVKDTVHLNEKGQGGSITVPGAGSFSVGNDGVSEAELGVPVYPGAVRGQGGMKMQSSKGSIISAIYLTSDAPTDVVTFYRGKLGAGVEEASTGQGSVLTSGEDSKNKVMVTVTKATGEDEGKTQILVMHTTSSGE